MNIQRLLAAVLFAAIAAFASAQDTSEVTALRAKAEKGNGIAQYNLGLAYAEGRGVPADRIEAYVWLSLARENGARGRALDNLIATFDKATLDAAEQKLAERKGGQVTKAAPRTVPTAPAPAPTPAAAPAASATPAADTSAFTQQIAALNADKKQLSAEVAQTWKENEGLKAELARTKQSLASLASAPKPAPDTAALDQKTRELQAAAAELEASRSFGRKVEDNLNKVTDQKTALETQLAAAGTELSRARQEAADLRAQQSELNNRLAAASSAGNAHAATVASLQDELARTKQSLAALAAAPKPAPDTTTLDQKTRELQAAVAELEASRAFGRKVEDNLNKVTDQKTALEAQLTAATTRQAAELSAALAAKSAALAQLDNLAKAQSSTQAQVASLTSERDTARSALAKAEQEKTALAAAQSSPAETSRQITALGEKFAAADKQATSLRQERDALSSKVNDLNGEVAQLRGDRERMQKLLADSGAKLRDANTGAGHAKDLEVQAAALQGRLTAQAADLSAAVTARTEALAQIAALTKAQTEAQAQAGKTENGLRSTIAQLEQDKVQLTASLNNSRQPDGRIEQAMARVDTLEKDLKAEAARRATAEASLAQANDKLSTQAAEAGRAKQDALALTTAKLEAEHALAAATSSQNDLKATVAKLEQDKKQLTAQATQLQTSLADAQKAKPAYPDLSGKVGSLEAQVATLQASLAAKPAAPAYPDLSSKVAELQSALGDSSRQLVAAQSAQQGLQQQLTIAQQNAAKARTTDDGTAQLRRERDELSGRVTTLAGEISQLRGDRERMQKLLADAGKQVRDGSADAARIKELETQATQLQASLADAQKAKPAYPDLSSKVAALETQLAAATQQAESASQTATTISRQSTADLNAAGKQIAQLQAALAAKPTGPTYPDLSGKVHELESALASANESARTATAASSQHEAELKAATAQVQELKSNVATLTADISQAREAAKQPGAPAYPDLSGKVAELQSALGDSSRQLVAAESAQKGLQQQLADATTALKTAKSSDESGQLRRERDELSGRVTSLAGEIAQLRSDRERMQKLLADAGKQVRDSTADAGRIKELETKSAALQNALAATQEQVSSLQGSLSAAQKAKPAYPDLSDKVTALEAQVGTLQTALAAKPAAPSYPDLSGRVRELETAVASADKNSAEAAERARNEVSLRESELKAATARIAQLQSSAPDKPAAPAYPDLSGRVSELQAELAAARDRGPAYPNLAGRVGELESTLADTKRQLAEAQTALHTATQTASTPAAPVVASQTEPTEVQKQLAETEDKLATALRGYALLEKEREADAAKAAQATEAVTNERNTLAGQVSSLTTEVEQLKAGSQASTGTAQAEIARLNESLAALQRSTAQNTTDLAATRALLQQVQGASRTLADENYQLKTRLAGVAGTTVAPAGVTPVPVPTSTPGIRTHVVAAGDSLSRLSQRYYGTANRWQEIYNANRDKIGTDGVLRVGVELRVP